MEKENKNQLVLFAETADKKTYIPYFVGRLSVEATQILSHLTQTNNIPTEPELIEKNKHE